MNPNKFLCIFLVAGIVTVIALAVINPIDDLTSGLMLTVAILVFSLRLAEAWRQR